MTNDNHPITPRTNFRKLCAELALEAAQRFYANGHDGCSDDEVKDDFDIIRRALESLPD